MSGMLATCLGCGCVCDDIEVTVERGRITEARHACQLGTAWFGDEVLPARAQVDGNDRPVSEVLDAATAVLTTARRPLIYLAADISCEAQREGIACADILHASLQSLTSATAMPAMLAAQERGRAGATLGEIRNRADVMLFWGVDPAMRYPRYWRRYAPEPAGMFVPEGRRSRRVIAVDIGARRGPEEADERVQLTPATEIATLTLMSSMLAAVPVPDTTASIQARGLAQQLAGARYAVIVADAEAEGADAGSSLRAHALAGLAQALNHSTRGALSLLRGGGNRSGADGVLTAQTGYPAAVDFRGGYPAYTPHRALAAIDSDAVLIVGAADRLPSAHAEALASVPAVIIGPRATVRRLHTTAAIDTGIAGIHSAGTAVRMDDVPIPLHALLSGPPDAAAICRELRERLAGAR